MKDALDFAATVAAGVLSALIYRAIDKRMAEREKGQAEGAQQGKHFRKPKK